MRIRIRAARLLVIAAVMVGLSLTTFSISAPAAPAEPYRAPGPLTLIKLSAHRKPKKKKKKSQTVKIVGSGVLRGVVPDWAVAAFATFEQPRATSISRPIADLFTGSHAPSSLRALGVDYHEARQLDVASRRFYLVPGKKAICVFYAKPEGGGGAACLQNGPLAYLNGVSVDLVPPPTDEQIGAWYKDQSKPYPTAGPVVTIGVAPRGVTQVLLHSTDQNRFASQVGEGYVGALNDYIIARTFSGPDILPYNSGPYTPLR